MTENTIEEYEPLSFNFSNEDVLIIEKEKWNDWCMMYFDGVVNVWGNGAGVVIISPNDKQYPILIKLQFSCTDNIAEYKACTYDLEAVAKI